MRRPIITSIIFTAFVACGSSDSNQTTSSQTGGSAGTAQGGNVGNGGEGLGFTVGVGGSTANANGGAGGGSCAQQSATPETFSRPIDIIFVIDNSSSMSEEIEEVERQINQNFATIINNADPPIDYRVIMVASWGCYSSSLDDGEPTSFCNKGGQDICIAAPLGGVPDLDNDGHCDLPIPTTPVNVPGRFYHHDPSNDTNNDDGVESHDALCRLGEDFNRGDSFGLQPNGYKDVLREDAFKFFVVITDDGSDDDSDSDCTWADYDVTNTFDDNDNETDGNTVASHWETEIALLSGTHFGTVQDRNYAFHSIVGLAPFNAPAGGPFGDPHPPTEPIETGECSGGSSGPGTAFQALSIRSNGFRYPSCALDYTEIFQEMANGVIAGAAIPCEYAIPDPPMGETLDLDTVVVEYTSGNNPPQNFVKRDSLADCTDDGYYIEDDKIKLCPGACAIVQGDPDASLDIKYGCEVDEQGVPS